MLSTPLKMSLTITTRKIPIMTHKPSIPILVEDVRASGAQIFFLCEDERDVLVTAKSSLISFSFS